MFSPRYLYLKAASQLMKMVLLPAGAMAQIQEKPTCLSQESRAGSGMGSSTFLLQGLSHPL